jgi:pimeloyl-ACP methyl ester carboxylesterase
MFKNMEEIWLTLQTQLSKSTSKGKLLIADGSGHHIHLEQPELVLNEIKSILEKK